MPKKSGTGHNKLVQMLESADVRKSLGSRMEDIVANPDEKFTRTLLRHRDHGLSRLELTFYGSRLHPLAVYQDRMDDARRLLDGCTTFDYSYEQQWIERAELIKAMVAVYIPGSKVFAYGHWWTHNWQEVRLYVVQGFSTACHASGCQLLVQRPSHLLCGGQS